MTVRQSARLAACRCRRSVKRARMAAAVARWRLRPLGWALDRRARLLVRSPRARAVIKRVRIRGRATVPITQLLLGGQEGWSSARFAEAIGDRLWPSTRLVDGPHVRLLRTWEIDGDALLEAERLASTEYVAHARRSMAAVGAYFGCTDADDAIVLAREQVDRYEGAQPIRERSGRSRAGERPRVRRIRHSDCYEIVDGHHRLAVAHARGARHAEVDIEWQTADTPLQELLDRMSWLEGRRELYQPVSSPELAKEWVLVRQCTDRLERMTAFLRARGICPPEAPSYLDVASCYGWFVGQMRSAGFDAEGMERDPMGAELGELVYGLPASRVQTGDAVDLLQQADRRWDVVSCFSLLHHFGLGRASVGPEDLLRLLDRVTGRVLFLDTGQSHERWFRDHLPGWDDDGVEKLVRSATTFDEILPLGRDSDGVGTFAGNYGRMLFACVRGGAV